MQASTALSDNEVSKLAATTAAVVIKVVLRESQQAQLFKSTAASTDVSMSIAAHG
jgi:hypothetical protein